MVKKTNALKSKQKKIVKTTEKAEHRFKDIIETTYDLIWETDKEGVYTYVNPRVKDFLGCKASEVLGKRMFDFMFERDAVEIEKIYRAKVKAPFQQFENARYHKDGHLVILETSGMPFFDNKNRIKGYRGIDRDITERRKAEMMLRISESTLREQKEGLTQKNIAIKEVIDHVEREKNKIKEDISTNINELILPVLKKLRIKGVPHKYIDMIQNHLEGLTSSFGRSITKKSIKLSPREIEVCSMIKAGLSSKEISGLMNISPFTVVKHRRTIRKKLGISNKKVNLITYMQGI